MIFVPVRIPSGSLVPAGAVWPIRVDGSHRRGPRPGAELHDTDWDEIVALYDLLYSCGHPQSSPSTRAVAVGFAHGPAAGLAALDDLATEPQLAGYGHFAAARADFLRRLGRTSDARIAYQEALLLTDNAVERGFLADRLDQLDN